MIIAWNQQHGETYGFKDIEAYKEWAKNNENSHRTCWEDEVYDVGEGGQTTDENQIEMSEFNASIT